MWYGIHYLPKQAPPAWRLAFVNTVALGFPAVPEVNIVELKVATVCVSSKGRVSIAWEHANSDRSEGIAIWISYNIRLPIKIDLVFKKCSAKVVSRTGSA